jgi:hypothetical protein
MVIESRSKPLAKIGFDPRAFENPATRSSVVLGVRCPSSEDGCPIYLGRS